MPALDELMARIRGALPAFLSGGGSQERTDYPIGYAQSRLGTHPALFMLPQDQYQSVQSQLEGPGQNNYATTKAPSPTYALDAILARLMGNSKAADIASNARREPTIYAPYGVDPNILKHEVTHAMTLSDVAPHKQALLQMMRPGSLSNYTEDQRAYEVPARLMTDPASIGNTPEQGEANMRKYLDMLPPGRAAQLAKLYKINYTPSGNSKQSNDTLTSFQKPNDTF